MLVAGKFHLTYCTNVHAGESWGEMLQQLKIHLPKVKQAVSPQEKFGTGLYLSDKASQEILVGSNLKEFKKWLDKEQLYVFTLNGFPFGNFHSDVVKDNVYKPDWTTRKRVEYTKRLFNILAELLPDGIEGGISTSPVSYKHWFTNNEEKEKAFEVACKHFIEMAQFLNSLCERTQKNLHLDIEPEPDCLLENSDDVINFFERLDALRNNNGIPIKKFLMLCFDVCHFSVKFENPESSLIKITSNGIKIGKIQLSSALKVIQIGEKKNSFRELSRFDEPRYLHQTVKRFPSGKTEKFKDLSSAIADTQEMDAEWRTHFHVPLFLNKYGNIESTQNDVVETIKFLQKNQATNHLEVETYTWDVLPADLKEDVTSSIVRELEWVKKNLAE